MLKGVSKVSKKRPESNNTNSISDNSIEIGKNEEVKTRNENNDRDQDKAKIPITFNSEQLKLIESYKGILGNTKAEIIRNIVINWMLNNKFDMKKDRSESGDEKNER